MKELCDVIGVLSLWQSTPLNFSVATPFEFDPQKEDSDAGFCYNCDVSVVIDKPSEAILQQFAHKISCIVFLKDTDGGFIILGDVNLPAMVSIEPALNKARLKIECKMLQSPLK